MKMGNPVIVCTKCGFRRTTSVERCPGRCRNKEYIWESDLGRPSQAIKDKNYWPLVLVKEPK